MDAAKLESSFASASWCTQLIRKELEPYSLDLPFDLEVKLELSAGKLGEQTVYRPYAVMASLLDRAVNTKHLLKGKGGSTFRDAEKNIAAWTREQAAIDASLGLIPPNAGGAGTPPSKGSFSVRTVPTYD